MEPRLLDAMQNGFNIADIACLINSYHVFMQEPDVLPKKRRSLARLQIARRHHDQFETNRNFYRILPARNKAGWLSANQDLKKDPAYGKKWMLDTAFSKDFKSYT